MSAPVLDPLHEAQVRRALDAACAVVGVDRLRVFEANRHLAARARLTAACALADADRHIGLTGTGSAWAARLEVNAVSLAPSQRTSRGVTPAMIAAVSSHLDGGALPGRMAEADPRPKGRRPAPKSEAEIARKAAASARAERVQRIIAARMKGERPTAIAEREGMDKTSVSKILTRSGQTFPVITPGPVPKPEKPRPERPATGTPTRRPNPENRPMGPSVLDHRPWKPLAGSEPVRLVDHRRGCRWPLEIGDGRTPYVCNLKTTSHGLYCAGHRAMSRPRSLLSGEAA